MEAAWALGNWASVGEVLEERERRGAATVSYSTIKNVMANLHEKGHLRKRPAGKQNEFVPVLSRDEFALRAVGWVVDPLLRNHRHRCSRTSSTSYSMTSTRSRSLKRSSPNVERRGPRERRRSLHGGLHVEPALLTSACALVVVPTLAWLVVRALAPYLGRMVDDPGWQAPRALAAAALPGMLFLIVGAATLRGGWDSACLQFVTGKVLYGAIAALTTFRIRPRYRACCAARARRDAAPAALVGSIRPRTSAGEALGIQIREVVADGPVMLLAGFFRPCVVKLSLPDAVRRVNDAELLAAIRHETAHSQRGDLICAAVVTFIAESSRSRR